MPFHEAYGHSFSVSPQPHCQNSESMQLEEDRQYLRNKISHPFRQSGNQGSESLNDFSKTIPVITWQHLKKTSLIARLVFIAQYHATSWVFKISNWQVSLNVIYWSLRYMSMRKCQSKAEKSHSNWTGHDWLPIFPANQLLSTNCREICSHLSPCERHPWSYAELILRDWHRGHELYLPPWKLLHNYHSPQT